MSAQDYRMYWPIVGSMYKKSAETSNQREPGRFGVMNVDYERARSRALRVS